MSDRPAIAIVPLSESFRRAWDDIAAEVGADAVELQEAAAPPANTVVVIVAAGGEEDRALDMVSGIQRPAGVPLYLVGAKASHRFAVEALRRGATDYFAFPQDLDILRRSVGSRVDAARERFRPADGEATRDTFEALQGQSDALNSVLEAARRVVRHASVTVLIQGETGTGKELLARALHEGSPRSQGPFVAVNCAAIPRELMESELFGHERGAFTDAHAAKPGLFEEAHRGTLFLDEIGHLPLSLQGKLLRALDDRRIRRVGSTQSREIDVRIITATHVQLDEAVREGGFREDLYYRINVVTLTLPPLRERAADIDLLAGHFAERLAARYGLPAPRITPEVSTALRGYRWPGNVRELQHSVERALLLSDPGTLNPAHLTPQAPPARASSGGAIPFPATVDEILAAAARAAITQYGGNKTAAARQLGISRARLQRLLERGEA
jgi:DNA-binding NtrC family response regulator